MKMGEMEVTRADVLAGPQEVCPKCCCGTYRDAHTGRRYCTNTYCVYGPLGETGVTEQ